jgi:hypothetical protein
MSNFFKIMMAATTLMSWAQRASADGVINEEEVVEVVTMLLKILDVKAEIKVKPIV